MDRRSFLKRLLSLPLFGLLGYHSIDQGFAMTTDNNQNNTSSRSPAPAIFMSHGAPTLLIDECPARDFLTKEFATHFAKPTAIVLVSAHWLTHIPMVTAAEHMQTIHDFGGFNRALYEMDYPVKGDPALAKKIVSLLKDAGMEAELDHARGLDHGAWIPLYHAYPEGDIPVLQLSIQMHRTPREHYAMGQALQALRDEGVMIIGSGGITHNLTAFQFANREAEPPAWVTSFNDWVYDGLSSEDATKLFGYRKAHEHGQINHPSPDHILPLFVAMGAGNQSPAKRLHHSYTYSVLSMDCYHV